MEVGRGAVSGVRGVAVASRYVRILRMIVDLADDRRTAKPWLPQDDRDVTNRLVVVWARWVMQCAPCNRDAALREQQKTWWR